MKRLNELVERVNNLSTRAGIKVLFPALRRFFSRRDIQEMLIRYNQRHLFDTQTNRNGAVMGSYVPKVARHKVKVGLPSVNYSLYERGSFFASMGVEAGDDSVKITSSSNGLDIDNIHARGDHPGINMRNISYMFSRCDPNRESLGLTDENFDNFVETSGIKENLITEIDKYLDGKNTD